LDNRHATHYSRREAGFVAWEIAKQSWKKSMMLVVAEQSHSFHGENKESPVAEIVKEYVVALYLRNFV
jgi:hypothetical protein